MITQAFILGAGLGTRLRPLTHHLPKPLVPLFHKPLALWAIETCEAVGCRRFAINTHHLAEKWVHFGAPREIRYFHEPVLLDTGGGLKQIETWLEDGSVLVHNGDIFSTLGLQKLIEAHEASGDEVTLALRSKEGEKRVSLGQNGRVIDLRSELLGLPGTHAFSGIYCAKKTFLQRIPPEEIVSIIPAFQELIRQNQLGAIVLDEGVWMDLGDTESYLAAHQSLFLQDPIHPMALVGHGSMITNSIIGKSAQIYPGIKVENSVIWPGAQVTHDVSGQIVIE